MTLTGLMPSARFLANPITADRAPAMELQFEIGLSVTMPVVNVIEDPGPGLRWLAACLATRMGAV